MSRQLGVLSNLLEDPGVTSQPLHGGSQPSVTLGPGDLMPSSGFCGSCTHTGIQMNMQAKTQIHKK